MNSIKFALALQIFLVVRLVATYNWNENIVREITWNVCRIILLLLLMVIQNCYTIHYEFIVESENSFEYDDKLKGLFL